MTNQLDLLDYPNWPGFKARDTSKAAADAMASKANTLRNRILAIFDARDERLGLQPPGYTADELARTMRRSVLAIRPRVTELAKLGQLKDSGDRRKNESGKSAIVWVRF